LLIVLVQIANKWDLKKITTVVMMQQWEFLAQVYNSKIRNKFPLLG
jgi:hypothetical protein